MKKLFSRYPFAAWGIAAVCGLMAISLLSLASAAAGTTEAWLYSQSVAFALGWGLALAIATQLRPWRWSLIPYGVYLSAVALLVAALVIGHEVAGHQSWFVLGAVSFQPSEWAKVALIVILAYRLAGHARNDSTARAVFVEIVGWTGGVAGLVFAQGDFGTAVLLLATAVPCLLIYPFPKKLLIGLLFLGLVGAGLTYNFVLSPYQKMRIHSFLNPEEDARGSGYHLTQSKITIGSGQWWGKGWKRGTHHALRYLPARQSDFIFAVWAEEWGFVGTSTLLALYALLFYCLWRFAEASSYREGYFLSLLVFWHLAIHLMTNLGGVLGLLPLTGVPLPLVSLGGSAIVSHFILFGLVMSSLRAPQRHHYK